MIKFFTYGTFRKNECRNYILERYKPEFIKTAATTPEYKLFNLGSFPGMQENGDKAVVGELYNLSEEALNEFDMIEGHPMFFKRTKIKLSDDTFAIAYIFPHECYEEIESGDWLKK